MTDLIHVLEHWKEIVMAERGNTKHGSNLDDQLKHETQGMVRGNKPAHAEEFRETEPFPDDTDPADVQEAVRPVADPDRAKDGIEDGEAEQ
jgi:hypothetical protein